MTEQALGSVVVAHLERDGWDVYQEVRVHGRGGRVADIVATRGSVLMIVELKKTLSLAVLGQAWRWQGYAHLRAVAVPASRSSDAQSFARTVAASFGIGVIQVASSWCDWRVLGDWDANPRMSDLVRNTLCDGHKTAAPAGSANGGHYTPFRHTRDQAIAHVAAHPGCTMVELVDAIKHHYTTDRSARATLGRWISDGVISELRLERTGRSPRVWLAEDGK